MKKIYLFATFLTITGFGKLQAQLTINNGLTPTQLVQNVLLGNGVQVNNVSITGDPLQFGSFTNTGTDSLRLFDGVILSTGQTPGLPVAQNNAGGQTYAVQVPGGAGDPYFNNLGIPTNDAAVLEFDFVPYTDTILFRYVFASEEYNEYTCSSFNDIFAFLITGPGYNGETNIAIVPGSNPPLPVAIGSINLGVVGANGNLPSCMSLAYANLFINNPQGSPAIEFDGLTVPLTAEAVVTPFLSYHIRLVIADAFDSAFDSGVFLEGASFLCRYQPAQVDILDGEPIVLENGLGARVRINVKNPAGNGDFPIAMRYAGEAVNGDDYQQLPDTLWVPDGANFVDFDIIPTVDTIMEAGESMRAIFSANGTSFDSIQVVISETLITGLPVVQNNLEKETRITPNPAHGATLLTWDSPLTGTVDVFDSQGRFIRTLPLDNCSQLALDLNGIPSGIISLRISSNRGAAMVKMVNY